MRTTDFMRMSHAQAAMKASDIAYDNEQLRQQLEMAEACLAGDNALIVGLKNDIAEKDAEIERLKTVPMKYRRMAFNAQLQDENRELEKQLAASQAREQQLRDELFAVLVQDMPDFKARLKVYAIPADTTALEAMIAKAIEVMRERCRKVAFDMAYADSMAVDVSQTIRALPGVTLEDIK